jgi:sterol desaturase/sphingolipid hydroxylase (fatty acid hydroxylase superfamily)
MMMFEGGSHSGKEIPVVTWFPPLSPIVGYFTGFDYRLIEYHTRHHQLYNCNYSISPWPDKLMGSYQMEYKTKKTDDETDK